MKLLCLVTIAVLTCGVTSNIKKDFLKEHNRLRKKHGANKLKWDKNLASFAQEHCDMLADNNKFEHNEKAKALKYGENLFKSWGNAAGNFAEAAVMAWYQEIKDYDFSNPGYSDIDKTGHFTQVGGISHDVFR